MDTIRTPLGIISIIVAFGVYYAMKLLIDNKIDRKAKPLLSGMAKLFVAMMVMAAFLTVSYIQNEHIRHNVVRGQFGASEAEAERAAACLGHRGTPQCPGGGNNASNAAPGGATP